MEARRLRDEWAVEVRSSKAPRSDRTATFKAVADDVLREFEELVAAGDLALRTLESYRTGINKHAVPMFGSRPIASITSDDVAAWVEKQQKSGAADWSIRARWTALRAVFSHAARHGLIASSPADVLKRRERPRHGRSRMRILDADEIRALLDNAGAAAEDFYRAAKLQDHFTRTVRVGIALEVFCGMRVSEALGLAPHEVAFDAGHAQVRYQLSRTGRRVPIKTDRHSNAGRRDVVLMEALGRVLRAALLALPPSAETIVATPYGRPMSYRDFRTAFRVACDAADLGQEVTPHALRHTFASILIDQGRPVEYVAQQLGHANTTTTWNTYVHLFRAREQADAARRGLDEGFGRMLGGA